MGLGCKALLVAAAMACAAAPALRTATRGRRAFTAVDYAWQANGTDATTLTIAPGQTRHVRLPGGHVEPTTSTSPGELPDCTGLPPAPRARAGPPTARSTAAGAYPFVCDPPPGHAGDGRGRRADPDADGHADGDARSGHARRHAATPTPRPGGSATPTALDRSRPRSAQAREPPEGHARARERAAWRRPPRGSR